MIPFNKFYYDVLTDGPVSSSNEILHLINVPMFSIYIDKNIFLADKYRNNPVVGTIKSLCQNKFGKPEGWKIVAYGFNMLFSKLLKEVCNISKKQINTMGFSSMHANIIIKDLGDEDENVKGVRLGLAYENKHSMNLNFNYIIPMLSHDIRKASSVITHEWAHLWMFQNSKAFKQTVKDLYNDLVIKKTKPILPLNLQNLAGDNLDDLREYVALQIKWVNGYGLTNEHEFWATAIENFLKLIPEHKKIFISLINNKINNTNIDSKEYKKRDDRSKPAQRRKLFKQKVEKTTNMLVNRPDFLLPIIKGNPIEGLKQLVDYLYLYLRLGNNNNFTSNIIYNSINKYFLKFLKQYKININEEELKEYIKNVDLQQLKKKILFTR